MTIDELAKDIPRILQQHGLRDVGFDTECIYDLGDLSTLLRMIMSEIYPDKPIQLHEELSPDKQYFVATLTTSDAVVVFRTHANDDWLADQFFEALENLPTALGSGEKLYSINPAVGLTGQEAWYFCGTEAQLVAARQAGLPLVFPGEDFMETDEFKKYVGD
ncbi:hypothetical protein MON38_05875 [Hymenobacter sp. DH14]|uniref:Uncharacterized protein n=1 Tax=Hymenobacter cyanobacteriorum TaxID=2926463 RepID=A0A9X2AH20_9BACT|nr:hypothetical protein [Hymenobacter cyanobacteriorum]MCI1186940.1 hypothetical protein [Hymenobacter cyanobacteriorum]